MSQMQEVQQLSLVTEPMILSENGEQTSDGGPVITDVWASNLIEAFRTIRTIVKTHKFIAMDTEFPGIVSRPLGNFLSVAEYHFQTLKTNVDLLKVIQLGITFFDSNGNFHPTMTTFQFNFKWSRRSDMSAQDSINLLYGAGIDFDRHETEGIDTFEFAQLMISSGLVLDDNVTFLSFHSGYDFGYLIKTLTNKTLPENERGFFEIVRIIFPNIYDVKYLMKSCKNLKGGLEEVAKMLEIPRFGPSHQAGSDSLLTGLVFFKIKELFFEDRIDEVKYSGHLFGLGICSVYAPTNIVFNTNQHSSSERINVLPSINHHHHLAASSPVLNHRTARQPTVTDYSATQLYSNDQTDQVIYQADYLHHHHQQQRQPILSDHMIVPTDMYAAYPEFDRYRSFLGDPSVQATSSINSNHNVDHHSSQPMIFVQHPPQQSIDHNLEQPQLNGGTLNNEHKN